jgi:hypothetical protein
MPNFPAASMGTMVVGLDIHTQAIPPAPPAPLPAPYMGAIFMWMSPKFPMCNVFVNSTPAAAVGSLGYSFHIPMGIPANPTNVGYWKRYLTNIPMALGLAALSIFANMAIAAITMLIPKPKAAESFIKDVTGIDTTSGQTFYNSVKASFTAYTKWATWVKLLMPPIPFPGGQGSVALGSPNVTINGANLGFIMPLAATSCSDIPVVPNANTLGFSNVLVGVSLGAILRGLAVNAAKAGVSLGVKKGVNSAKKSLQGKQDCGCK